MQAVWIIAVRIYFILLFFFIIIIFYLLFFFFFFFFFCCFFNEITFRAKSGQATSETFTEVIFGETSVIDTTATGVAENTTEKISIKCQASGVPRPSFELRLFDEYGPDLMKAGIYQVLSYSLV